MKFLATLIVAMFFVSLIPMIDAKNIPNGFNGVSWKPVVPMKKVILVNFDENSYLDDYACLAAIPASIFYDESRDCLFSNPLLFYQDLYVPHNKKERSLNARQGIDYFMEDWMAYCNGELDKMITINVPESKIRQWRASNYTFIEDDDPYEIASKIALHEWSYSDNAVIAVIEETFEKPDNITHGKVEGTLQADKIKEEYFTVEQTNSLNPVYHEFIVDEKYRYIKAEVWWDLLIIAEAIMIPTGDPDVQLYCKHGGEWMQAACASYWNIFSPLGHEPIESYAYEPGQWRVGITDVPTEGNAPRRDLGIFTVQGSLLRALLPPVNYNVDVRMFPGMEIKLPDNPPFGCRDAMFKLTWDDTDVSLGFSIIGPGGEEIVSAANESKSFQKIHLDQLGECLDHEKYSICIFAMDNVSSPIHFEVEYNWHQNISELEGDCLSSATEGAVLASMLNAPLLYTSPSSLPDATKDALNTLGVRKIHLVNLGDHLSRKVKNEINDIIKEYKEHGQIYDAIRKITDRNDIIFTTIDPWSYWLAEELKPAGELPGALFIGPAAYIAAHHGSPVLIIDNHPRCSSSVIWHTEFWKRHAGERYDAIPSVAEMYLTGKRVYDFLREYGFDREGIETMITIADQYDIGIPWDRVFVGKAKPGRICGTPVDTSYWICRNVFYPALIFINPALSGKGVLLIDGSVSERRPTGILGKPYGNTLFITRPSQEEVFNYPVLCSFVTHKHRFNERASKYYGFKYQCADGMIPGETNTLNPIDQGIGEKYYGKKGCFFPDMTESEIVPFYLERGGYGTAFSTSFHAVTNNLNEGVIMWIHGSHGSHPGGGGTLFWNPENGFEKHSRLSKLVKPFVGAVKEENPWRGYEWLLGSTEEPDTMSMDMKGIIPFTNIHIPLLPALGMDWVVAQEPIREFLNEVIPFVDPFTTDDLYDGVVGSLNFSRYQYEIKRGYEIDESLKNLHSVGFITSICQTSNTYFHLALVRHGSVFQVQDPWPTSWYGAVWRQSIPRDIILGDTIGEAYVKGISHVGILYITDPPQWWWDMMENVVLYGDPDLRVWVPSTEYSDKNHWDEPESLVYAKNLSINGHMPFGATSYPHEIKPFPWSLVIGIALVVAVVGIIILFIRRRSQI